MSNTESDPARRPVTARPGGPLTGTRAVPGDKSISHRALMLGGLAVGATRVRGLLLGADVRATAAAMRALGAEIDADDDAWTLYGRGVGGLTEPPDVLDLGNSGTSARLLLGLIGGHDVTAFVTGDASLRRRPMQRVIDPLTAIGASFTTRSGGRLPLAVTGARDPLAIQYELPVASAQVKSAVLLAGLTARGETAVTEPADTRDHTERMLRAFGAELTVARASDGRRVTRLTGQPELTGQDVTVPGDPSSAAFPLVAALLVRGSDVRLPGVGMNPHRTGLITTLQDMGADLTIADPREDAGEPVADLVARAGELHGVDVPAERAPAMIDEYPILAVAAACAHGRTVMHGVGELRVKESDRLAGIVDGLRACGVTVESGDDWLAVTGHGGPPPGGATIAARLDHRMAMAFLVLGMAARAPVAVDDAGPIATSFPDFVAAMRDLGADIAG
jgi:3-phosphoshikimate 1-carboxyvinyltransferase